MTYPALDAGIAVLCDQEGTILEIVRDELGADSEVAPGRPLSLVVDRASLGKMLNFLATLRAEGATFDWEINVPLGGEITPLHFGGVALEDKLLILAAKTRNGVTQLYEEMMRIGNEQANALRAALKARSEMAQAQAERDSTFYDDLSRLNNELANLQRELAKKNVQLEQLNEQKNQLLGMAAHDLRNPLGVIMGFSEFLLNEATDALEEEHAEFLTIIHDSSEFMLRLVDDLLDVAKIESGKLQLDPRPTDLLALVEHSVTLNRVLAARKEIEIELAHDGDLPPLELDGPKIEQVLNNLLSNAVKFSFPGSQIRVGLTQKKACVVISVQDEGQGIPEDERDKLFRPFQRTSVQSTGGESSTGLGLAITKRIVTGHGGRIWVESEVGRGSTFYVELPMPDPDPAT